MLPYNLNGMGYTLTKCIHWYDLLTGVKMIMKKKENKLNTTVGQLWSAYKLSTKLQAHFFIW